MTFLYPPGITGLNINSIRNKFDDLKLIIDEKVDVLEIDEPFPTAQFNSPGYSKPYRLDISGQQEGLLVSIKSHLPSSHNTPSEFQRILIELNLRKEKWKVM